MLNHSYWPNARLLFLALIGKEGTIALHVLAGMFGSAFPFFSPPVFPQSLLYCIHLVVRNSYKNNNTE